MPSSRARGRGCCPVAAVAVQGNKTSAEQARWEVMSAIINPRRASVSGDYSKCASMNASRSSGEVYAYFEQCASLFPVIIRETRPARAAS